MKNLITTFVMCLIAYTTLNAQGYPIANGNHSEKFYTINSSLETAPNTDMETELFLIGKAYVLKREWSSAISTFENYKIKYPKGKYIDEVLFWQAKSWNTLANNENSIEYFFKLKVNAVSNLSTFLSSHPSSLWYDDAYALYELIGNEFILIGNDDLKARMISNEMVLWDFGENTKLKALGTIKRLKRPVAIHIIKELLNNETSIEIKTEVVLALVDFPEEAVEILNNYLTNEKDKSLKKVAKNVLNAFEEYKLPVSLSYSLYSFHISMGNNLSSFPANELIEKTTTINNISKFQMGSEIENLLKITPSNLERQAFSSDINEGLIKNRLKKLYPSSIAIGNPYYVTHNIHGFNFNFFDNIKKEKNRISGNLKLTPTRSIRITPINPDFIVVYGKRKPVSKTYEISKNKSKLFFIRSGNLASAIFIQFESDIETDLDKINQPKYYLIFNRAMDSKVHSGIKSINSKEIESNVIDYGEAKVEIPSEEGIWTLLGKSVLGDKKNRQFIARGAKLFNHLGELVKEASQIIVPADNPAKYKIK